MLLYKAKNPTYWQQLYKVWYTFTMARRMGRPLKFETVEDLQQRIDKYFACTPITEWTITGLALALDTSRETLMNYESKEEYFDAVKKAKEMVHNAYELDMRKRGRTTDIFALKNFGWRDRQELDHTTKGKPISILNGLSSNNSNAEDSETK
jgi:hypothetical protein